MYKQALTSRHSRACQSHVLVPLAALACWEGVTMAYEDGAVFAMGLDQQQ
jgi:hypothetical protein